MIDQILNLAKMIESEWSQGDFSIIEFPSICKNHLLNFEYNESLDDLETELKNWLIESKVPNQLNVYNTFGQPPITVFNNGKFIIDIYFWMHTDTSIHSHSFSGAFKVLFGKSCHEVYNVKPKNIFSPDVMSTYIDVSSKKDLNPGSVQKITPGIEFNHRVTHLDKPTVTLCIRTVDDVNTPQWHHFSNGLSVHKKEMPETVIKSLFYYQYLFNRDENKGKSFLEEFITKLDFSTLLNIYEQIYLGEMGIDEIPAVFLLQYIKKTYGQTEWFKLYESFYSNFQDNIDLEDFDTQTDFIV